MCENANFQYCRSRRHKKSGNPTKEQSNCEVTYDRLSFSTVFTPVVHVPYLHLTLLLTPLLFSYLYVNYKTSLKDQLN